MLEDEQSLNNKNLKFIGKPFNNPFEIFVFNKTNKILNIQSFQELIIQQYDLNDYGPSSAYCNGNNHLYISGGEKNDNQIIDTLLDINLINNMIDGPFTMSPKKNHSMIFISPDKVFIVGGNDTKTFYFDINEKKIIDKADLNIIRTEPALQVIDNILYCFDNINKANNEELSFEKINFDNPDAEWEIIYPKINKVKFSQKFFAVSKDNKGENIFFLGGNKEDYNDSEGLQNFKYNIESNTIEQTNIPFHDFNFKEKTFLPYNKSVDYLLPDFNRQHPEVTFFVKNKSRFEKVNYLPKTDLNNNNYNIIQKRNYKGNYNFNMPITKISLENNNYLPGIHEPSFDKNNGIDNKHLKIDLEPPFKEPDIEPNQGDKQINIDIPTNLEEMQLELNKNKKYINFKDEEEKNSNEYQNGNKLYNGSLHIYNGYNLLNNNDYNKNSLKYPSSINVPGNTFNLDINKNINLEEPIIKKSLNDNNININQGINIEKPGSINPELIIEGKNQDEYNIHLPKKEGLDLEGIKLNAQINQANKPNIEIGNQNFDTKININNIGNRINKNLGIGQDNNFYMGGTINMNSNDFQEYGIISGDKNYKQGNNINVNQNGLKINIDDKGLKDQNIQIDTDVKIKNPDINAGINAESPIIQIEKKDFKLTDNNPEIDIKPPKLDSKNEIGLKIETPRIESGVINNPNINIDMKNPKVNVPDLNIKHPDEEIIFSGIIKGTKKVDIPKIKGDIKVGGDIKGPEIKEPKINANIPEIKKDININTPEIQMPSADLNLKGKNIKGPNISLGANIPNADINAKIPNIEGNIPNVDLKANIPNIEGNIPKVNLNTNIPNIESNIPNVDLNTNIPNIESNIPNADINAKIPNIEGNLPNIDLNTNIPNIESNIPKFDVNAKIPNIEGNMPNVDLNTNIPKIEGNIQNVDLNANIPNVDLNTNIPNIEGNLPKADINANIPELQIPNINGKIDTNINLPSSEINLKKPDINGNIENNIKIPGIDASIEKPEIKGKDIKITTPKININTDNSNDYCITGIIPGGDFNQLNIKGSRRMLGDYNINQPDINIKTSKLHFDKPDVNIKGSRRLDIEGPNINGDIKANKINTKINALKLDVPSGKIDMKMPKVDIKSQQNANIKGSKINLDGKIPDLNIKGSDEEIIFSGIIKGTKKIDIPNIKGDIKVDGDLKGPEIKLPNVEAKVPEVGLNLKRKELDINKNIKDVQINIPEVDINSKDINLKGKNIKPNISLEGNLPGVDINKNIPNIDIEGNMQNLELNTDLPNFDIDGNKLNADMNVNKPNINLEGNIPSVGINGNIPELGLDTNMKDININKNINIPSGDINIEGMNSNININSPRIDLPSGNFDFKENIKGKNINMPKFKASIDKPEFKDINLEANLPEIDINKKDINLNSKKIKLEGELPEINKPEGNINLNGDIEGKDIKIPNINFNAENKNEYYLTGLIPGADFNNINIKGPRRMVNSVNVNQPDINIKTPKLHLDQQDYNLKGSRRLDINKPMFDDVKGSRMMYNTQINSKFKNSNNMKEINVNSPKIKIDSGKLDLKAKVPEINKKIEEEILFTGVIKGDKSYNKNINVNANLPIENINIKIDEPKIKTDTKEEIITGIIPSNKEVNLEAKKFNLVSDQNIDIKVGNKEVINSINNFNTNTEINVPKLNVETDNNQKGINIGIPSLEVNLDSKEKEENNNLFNVNINTNIENPLGSLEENNSKIGQENKVYAKKRGIGLPKVGNKNMEFKASKIDVAGKMDVNNVDITNQKSANVGVNGAKIGSRIEE